MLFDIVFLEFDCAAAVDKLKRQLGALTKLNYDAIMGSLYAEDVITDNEIKIIDDKIGQQKMMYLIVDIIIPSLRLKHCKKYKGFLKAMEESDDSDLRSTAEKFGKFFKVLLFYGLNKLCYHHYGIYAKMIFQCF